MHGYYELHSHLYGCLQEEDLRWLASRRRPRWSIFLESYSKVYGKKANIEGIFSYKAEAKKRLQDYYYLRNKSGFAAFQTCFDFVIALSHCDPEEIKGLCLRVAEREPADYAEYRMMFPPTPSREKWEEGVISLCEGLHEAKKTYGGKTFHAALSLRRDTKAAYQEYERLLSLMQKNTLVQNCITAIDFCHQEEGYPPKDKREFCEMLLRENAQHPQRALAILYHVGESFTDKSLESSVRWVVEAAQMGAHRLGHAIALGIEPACYENSCRYESARERLDQIAFEKKHASSLRAWGYHVDLSALDKEKEELQRCKSGSKKIRHDYGPKRLKALFLLQNWAMAQIKAQGSFIECCPTSNLRIGSIPSHPLRRFLEAGLKVVIGADDPGILESNIKQEFEVIQKWPGIGSRHIAKLQTYAKQALSPLIASRISSKAGERQNTP